MVYDIYRYAPESFKLYIKENNKNHLLKIDSELLHDLGYTLITKGEQEMIKQFKIYLRKESKFSQKINKFRLGIAIKNTSQFVKMPYSGVEQYNISEHLQEYKTLKECLEYNNFKDPIIITTGKLDGNYKMLETKDETQKLELSKRTYLRMN